MVVAMSAGVAVIIVTSVAVGGLGSLYAAKTQAQTAADAAALAAAVATYPPASVTAPVRAAAMATQANGSVLLRCDCPRDPTMVPRTVQVIASVEVDVPVFGPVEVRASSRAEFDPRRWLGR
jgi:hypothetical protein